ncbi:MAG: hypothetical protein ACP5M5_13005, partial [Acidibrevibacterium sp.]|uniref:hypothetical protein n=1 Tax=Acidibrevibacterium sp. TaxID=2606776 RepID=UPI003D050A9D
QSHHSQTLIQPKIRLWEVSSLKKSKSFLVPFFKKELSPDPFLAFPLLRLPDREFRLRRAMWLVLAAVGSTQR